MPSRIFDQACAWAAASATALIEYHDAVVLRVEELPSALVGTGAGAAVQEHRRFAGGVAAFLVIDLMDLRDPQVAVPKGLERGIQLAAAGVACLDGTCREFCRGDRAFLLGRRVFGRRGPPRCGACFDCRAFFLRHRYSS